MTRKSKEKLWFFLKEEKYRIGQKILKEGQISDYVYLILSGEFEITKYVYTDKNNLSNECTFSTLNSLRSRGYTNKMFDSSSRILLRKTKWGYDHFK